MSGKSYRIKLCWGAESGECPNLIQLEANFKKDLQDVIDDSGWPECLEQNLARQVKPLDQFSISVSGCPNGCSRPQIADFGLLQARQPQVIEDMCSGCAECIQVCREGAIELKHGIANIDSGPCLSCGACICICPENALITKNQAYRIQVGGKLGRHPRLADELPGIYDNEAVFDILNKCLKLHQSFYKPGLRFGQVIARQGIAELINKTAS
jgi:dissimilatory sulfite reductase (desulfoviridin) alpha/beta subunit